MSTETISKKCTNCDKTKDISMFGKRKSSKDGLNNSCKVCSSNYMKEYQKKNEEILKEYRKEYVVKNKEKRKEYRNEYNKKNKLKISDDKKKFYRKNKKKIGQKSKEHRENNKEYYVKYNKSYRCDNKEYLSKYKKEYGKTEVGRMSILNACHKRRDIKFSKSDGTIPQHMNYPLTKELQDLLDRQDNKCNNCKCKISREKKNIQLDHHIPISRGGHHSISNVVFLCNACNLTKGAKVPDTLLLI